MEIDQLIKNDVLKFVNNYFEMDIMSSNREEATFIGRSFFCYLCVKYTTDISTSLELARFLKIKTHGTIINNLRYATEDVIFDKKYLHVLTNLEYNFVKHFATDKFNKDIKIESYDNILLKQKLSYTKLQNEKHRSKIYILTKKIASLENKVA